MTEKIPLVEENTHTLGFRIHRAFEDASDTVQDLTIAMALARDTAGTLDSLAIAMMLKRARKLQSDLAQAFALMEGKDD